MQLSCAVAVAVAVAALPDVCIHNWLHSFSFNAHSSSCSVSTPKYTDIYMYTYISTLHISTFCYKRPLFRFYFRFIFMKRRAAAKYSRKWHRGKERVRVRHPFLLCMRAWVELSVHEFPYFSLRIAWRDSNGAHTTYYIRFAKRKPWRHRMWFIKLHDLEKRFSFIPFVNISIIYFGSVFMKFYDGKCRLTCECVLYVCWLARGK